jgi:hypothetical protein
MVKRGQTLTGSHYRLFIGVDFSFQGGKTQLGALIGNMSRLRREVDDIALQGGQHYRL